MYALQIALKASQLLQNYPSETKKLCRNQFLFGLCSYWKPNVILQ